MRKIMIYYVVKLTHTTDIVGVELDIAKQFLDTVGNIFEINPIDPCLSDFDIWSQSDLDQYIEHNARYSTKKVGI